MARRCLHSWCPKNLKSTPRRSQEGIFSGQTCFLSHDRSMGWLYTWNLFVLYFGGWTLQNKVFSNQNKGHLGHLGPRYLHSLKVIPFVPWIRHGQEGHEPWQTNLWGIGWGHPLHSLKLTASLPLKIGRNWRPKRKPDRIPTIHFQVLWLLVSGRVNSMKNILKENQPSRDNWVHP